MLFTLSICLLWLCASSPQTAQAELDTSRDERQLAPNNADFALKLYKHLVASAPGENILISPISISMALAMLSLGTHGHTRTQILQGLGFNLTQIPEAEIHRGFQHLRGLLGEPSSSGELAMGNALFFNRSLDLGESFLTVSKCYYALEGLAADFQDWDLAGRQINEFVNNRTQGKISNLFLEPEDSAPLILVNYIFFKGLWAHGFDPARTQEENFYVNKTTTVKVSMMSMSSAIRYLRDPELPCQVVQLEYTGNGTVFFILPDLDEGALDTVLAALSRDTIGRWSTSLSRVQMKLSIPKVSISGVHDLWNIMVTLGLVGDQVDLSGMAQKDQLKKPKVLHKAVLQVDEQGAEPAPPTLSKKSDPEPITVQFNRPFMAMEFDHFTWSNTFLNFVVNPS